MCSNRLILIKPYLIGLIVKIMSIQLLAARFQIHPDNPPDNHNSQNDKPYPARAFILAHYPDQEYNKRQYKNCPEYE